MHIIRNIINYDPDYLERLSDIAMKQCEGDKKLEKLIQEKERFSFFFRIAQFVTVSCLAVLSGILITRSDITYSFIPLGIILLILSFLLRIPPLHEKNYTARNQIIDTYISPAVKYHHLVSAHHLLVCYGRIVDDSKFEATLIALANTEEDNEEADRLCLTTIVFRFDNKCSAGSLTLDVGNGVVYFADCEGKG